MAPQKTPFHSRSALSTTIFLKMSLSLGIEYLDCEIGKEVGKSQVPTPVGLEIFKVFALSISTSMHSLSPMFFRDVARGQRGCGVNYIFVQCHGYSSATQKLTMNSRNSEQGAGWSAPNFRTIGPDRSKDQ